MVPNGWEYVTFGQLINSGDITKIQDGNHGNSHPKASDFVAEGIPFVMARDLSNGSIDLSNCAFITKKQADSLRIGFAIEGDVLISHKGTVGEVAIVPEVDDYVMLTPQVTYYRMSSHSKLQNKYLYQYFLSNDFQSRLKSLASQSTRSYLGITAQKDLYIDLPPLPEQRKIAQILSTWDRGIATTKKLIDASKQQKKALMQQLLTGKKRLIDPETGKAFEGDWEEVKLGEILKIGSGKDYKHLEQGNVPVYGTGGYMLSVSNYLYDGDSVCIGRKGTIDKPMFLTGKFWTVDTLFFTHSFNQTTPHFIYQYFLTINWKKYNEASGVPSLSKSIIEKISIKIPTLEEQQKIASVLIAADKEIELLNAKLAHFKQEKKALMQQLLTGKRRVYSLSS